MKSLTRVFDDNNSNLFQSAPNNLMINYKCMYSTIILSNIPICHDISCLSVTMTHYSDIHRMIAALNHNIKVQMP